MPDEAGASSALAEPVRVEEQPLGLLLHRAQSALRTEVTATALKSMGLTFREYICMRILRRSPGKSNAELAFSCVPVLVWELKVFPASAIFSV